MSVFEPIRAIIVDDEEPARRLIRSMLQHHERITVVGEAADCRAAIELITRERPALVFLDVQMPGGSGFDVLAAIGPDEMPMVVFATAYDRFALDAFRVSACDYLLKPFDDARFGEALTKVMSRSSSSSTVLMESLRTLLTHTSTAPSKHLVVKVNGRHVFVDSDSIIRIEASGKEVRLHTTRFVQVVREGLTSIGERLDTATFIRVHRSAIVNRTHITEVQPWFRGEYVIVMKDGSKLTSGRHYQHVIRQLLQRA